MIVDNNNALRGALCKIPTENDIDKNQVKNKLLSKKNMINNKRIMQGTQIYLSIKEGRYVVLILENYLYNNEVVTEESGAEIDEINKGDF